MSCEYEKIIDFYWDGPWACTDYYVIKNFLLVLQELELR
jgi:hypothetical protein